MDFFEDEGMPDSMREYILNEINSNIEIKQNSEQNCVKSYLESKNGSMKNYNYGMTITQGICKNMNIKYIIESFLGNQLIILLNGHNGNFTVDYCKRNLMRLLNELHQKNSENSINNIHYFKTLFIELIKIIESDLLLYSMEHNSGSTITILYSFENYILSLNLGDSKSILIHNNYTYYELTNDHKPYIPIEKKRIENAKGSVFNGLINNMMKISRSLGDFKFKCQKTLKENEQILSNEPYTMIYTKTNIEKYIILSNSGIWDVFTNQKIIDYIEYINKKNITDLKYISELIVKKSIKEGNLHNAILIIIEL